MAIGPEFGALINTAVNREFEERDIVPYSFGHRTLLTLARQQYKSPKYQERVMAKYSPLAEWLAQPKTMAEFMELKSNLYSLACNVTERRLFGEFQLRARLGVGEGEWETKKEEWFKTLAWVFSLAGALEIFPQENIENMKRAKKQREMLGASVYQETEGFDEGFISVLDRDSRSLEELSRTLYYDRQRNHWIDGSWEQRLIRRVGLIIADLRVGDHAVHGKFFERAKWALGRRGALVVITPSKNTILNTTDKKDSWDDEDRLYRLRSNRNIDFSLVADMPRQYYRKPNEYWQQVWKAIHPDFVFLGEENHPLEDIYRQQSRYLGGILVIDDSPVTKRSGDLLAVK